MDLAWELVGVRRVGGLTDVGFLADGRHLLVIGHQGRGLIDCATGELVARDPREDWAFLGDGGYAEAMGLQQDRSVKVAGLMSGATLPATAGEWTATALPDGVLLATSTRRQAVLETEELRAFGFARSGRIFVLATSSSLRIYRRLTDDL